MGNFVTITG
jgi:hypothetical protein